MHRWLLVLMIALLPLRGWVGEAMAGQMLAQQLHTANSSVMQADAMADCPGHPAAAQAPSDKAADPTCTSCAHCQACSTVALQPAPARALPAPTTYALPATGAAHFASALPVPALKPPIS
jgi:hypothetical protein